MIAGLTESQKATVIIIIIVEHYLFVFVFTEIKQMHIYFTYGYRLLVSYMRNHAKYVILGPRKRNSVAIQTHKFYLYLHSKRKSFPSKTQKFCVTLLPKRIRFAIKVNKFRINFDVISLTKFSCS